MVCLSMGMHSVTGTQCMCECGRRWLVCAHLTHVHDDSRGYHQRTHHIYTSDGRAGVAPLRQTAHQFTGTTRYHRYARFGRCLFFFFQAEDGIRDLTVTGVQTCALPISFYGGHCELSFGVMGAHYQPMGHAQIVTNIVDYAMDVQAAIDAPRAFFAGGM